MHITDMRVGVGINMQMHVPVCEHAYALACSGKCCIRMVMCVRGNKGVYACVYVSIPEHQRRSLQLTFTHRFSHFQSKAFRRTHQSCTSLPTLVASQIHYTKVRLPFRCLHNLSPVHIFF